MNRSAIKIIVCVVSACAGIASHADADPKARTPATGKRHTGVPRFAIAGLVDVDKDGKSDLELIRRLIKLDGGAIDAELGIDGKLTGELRRDTDYIILGELPDKSTVSQGVATQFHAFMRRATELNTRVLHLDRLLRSGTRRTATESDTGFRFRSRRRPPERWGSY